MQLFHAISSLHSIKYSRQDKYRVLVTFIGLLCLSSSIEMSEFVDMIAAEEEDPWFEKQVGLAGTFDVLLDSPLQVRLVIVSY